MGTSVRSSSGKITQRKRGLLSSWITLAVLGVVLLILFIIKVVIPMIPSSMTSALGNPKAHMDETFVVRGEVQKVQIFDGPFGPVALYLLKDKSGEGWVSDARRGKNPPKKGDVVSRRVKVMYNTYRGTTLKTDEEWMFLVDDR